MADAALTVFVSVGKADRGYFESHGKLRCGIVSPGRDYIGLLGKADDAQERQRKIQGAADVCLIRVVFTSRGVAQYTTTIMGASAKFSSQLHKVTYSDDKGWEVWHFVGDIPLREENDAGELLVFTEWLEVE